MVSTPCARATATASSPLWPSMESVMGATLAGAVLSAAARPGGTAGWWPAARPRGPAAGRDGPRAAWGRARAGGSSARRNASALPPLRYGSRSSYDAREPAVAASRAIQGSITRSETMLRRSTAMVAAASRSGSPLVNSRSTGSSTRSAMTSRTTVSSLAADVRRLRERGERVRAVGDGVRPALAGHEAAQVALAQQPGREPVAPLEHLAARHQRPLVVAGDALAEDQRGEAAPEHRVGVLLAQARRRARRPSRRRGPRAGRRRPRGRPRSPASGRPCRRAPRDRCRRACGSARR